jgi:hypothetical protein
MWGHRVIPAILALHKRPQWQWISAMGGGMVFGSTRVSKGEEQETRMQETA